MTEQSTTFSLSRTGRIRRDTMLVDLRRTMERHHTRRRQVSRTVGGLVLAITGGMATLLAMHPATPPSPPSSSTPPVVHAATHIVWVKSDPDIGERMEAYTKAASAPRVMLVDDRELLVALEEMDRPTGLIRMNGLVKLTMPVTDAELEGSDAEDSPPA